MNLEATNCTIVNKGTIMNIGGCSNVIENYGTVMGGYCQAQPQVHEKVVYRDRVVYRNRPPGKSNLDDVNVLKQQIQKLISQIKSSKNASIVHRLENDVSFYKKQCTELKKELERLKEELEDTNRTKLLKQIEELEENLKRSMNRERVSKQQQYEKGYQAGIVDGSNRKIEVFDWGVKPSREEAAALLKQIKIWLDCED